MVLFISKKIFWSQNGRFRQKFAPTIPKIFCINNHADAELSKPQNFQFLFRQNKILHRNKFQFISPKHLNKGRNEKTV